MDKKYTKRFLLVLGCPLLLTIGISYYYKLQASITDFITFDQVNIMSFHHSEESDTYNSSNAEQLKKVFTFLQKIDVKHAKDFEETNRYCEVIFSRENNFFRKSFKFYNNGIVEIMENGELTMINSFYKLKNEEDLENLIYRAINKPLVYDYLNSVVK